VELENLLANQKELAKKMGTITIKEQEEALFTSKMKGPPRNQWKPKPRWSDDGKYHPKERSGSSGGAHGREDQQQQQQRMMDATIAVNKVILLENVDCQGCALKGM